MTKGARSRTRIFALSLFSRTERGRGLVDSKGFRLGVGNY